MDIRFEKGLHLVKRKPNYCFLIVIFLMAVVIMIPIPSLVFAEALPNRIVDNAEVLSELQLDTMKNELANLKEISMIIVINDVGSRCTDEYAYSVAKEMHQDIFPSGSNGIVIAYCTSLEGYKVGVYYKGDFSIDTKALQQQIVNEYKLYSTDSAWIEGSISNVVKSLNAIVQRETAPTVAPTSQLNTEEGNGKTQSGFWVKFGIYQMITSTIVVIFLAGMITAIHFYRKHRKQIDKDIDYWMK